MSRFRRQSLVKPLAAEVLEPRCLMTEATGTLAAADAAPLTGDVVIGPDLWDDAGLTLLRVGDLVHVVRTGTTHDVVAPFAVDASAQLIIQGRDNASDVLTLDVLGPTVRPRLAWYTTKPFADGQLVIDASGQAVPWESIYPQPLTLQVSLQFDGGDGDGIDILKFAGTIPDIPRIPEEHSHYPQFQYSLEFEFLSASVKTDSRLQVAYWLGTYEECDWNDGYWETWVDGRLDITSRHLEVVTNAIENSDNAYAYGVDRFDGRFDMRGQDNPPDPPSDSLDRAPAADDSNVIPNDDGDLSDYWSSLDNVLLIGQGIATVGIEDRELAEFDTASSDSAFGELADSEPEDGDALAANGDTNSADMGEGLELDAALSNDFLVSLAESFPK